MLVVPPSYRLSYSVGMKTAVSIPEEILRKVERLARQMKKSRSELFIDALTDYLARHTPNEATQAMNQVCDEVGIEADAFSKVASRRILERVEW